MKKRCATAAFEADDGCNLTTTETYIGMTSI